MPAASFSLYTAINEIQICHQMFHFNDDSTGVHKDGQGLCPEPRGMQLSPTPTIITNEDF